MKRQILSRFTGFLLALLMLFSLAACSASGESGSKIDKTNNQPIVVEIPVDPENQASREANGWIGFAESVKIAAQKYEELLVEYNLTPADIAAKVKEALK